MHIPELIYAYNKCAFNHNLMRFNFVHDFMLEVGWKFDAKHLCVCVCAFNMRWNLKPSGNDAQIACLANHKIVIRTIL